MAQGLKLKVGAYAVVPSAVLLFTHTHKLNKISKLKLLSENIYFMGWCIKKDPWKNYLFGQDGIKGRHNQLFHIL